MLRRWRDPVDGIFEIRGRDGEALLRRRKPWYYEHEPRPDRTVIGARLSELISR